MSDLLAANHKYTMDIQSECLHPSHDVPMIEWELFLFLEELSLFLKKYRKGGREPCSSLGAEIPHLLSRFLCEPSTSVVNKWSGIIKNHNSHKRTTQEYGRTHVLSWLFSRKAPVRLTLGSSELSQRSWAPWAVDWTPVTTLKSGNTRTDSLSSLSEIDLMLPFKTETFVESDVRKRPAACRDVFTDACWSPVIGSSSSEFLRSVMWAARDPFTSVIFFSQSAFPVEMTI